MSYSELYHYGIKGMKWGVRRYQNKDGSYTDAGKRRNAKQLSKVYKKTKNAANPYATSEKFRGAVEKKVSKVITDKDRTELGAAYKKVLKTTEAEERSYSAKTEKEALKAWDDYVDKCKGVADKILGECGSQPINNSYSRSDELRNVVGDAIATLDFDKVGRRTN